ncbi:glycosyltransferase family 2 protein [Planctomycetota bacterium]
MRLSLTILTYNEITGLRALYDRIPVDAVDEVVAIDGGSTDGTVEFLRSRGVDVYGQDAPGRGEAFRIAFRRTSGDALLFFSPDGNENPGDIPKFRPLLEAGNDMVIATRMVVGAHNEEDVQLFRWRKWANNAFTLMANVSWNRQKFLSDAINGFRAITRDAWQRMVLDGHGYTIEYQSSIRAFKCRMRIAEFPTHESSRLDDRQGSPSINTGVAFLRLYLSELFRGYP